MGDVERRSSARSTRTRYLIRRPLLQALQAPRARRGAADRRGRPRRRALRGLPARIPGRVPGEHSRDRHRARAGDAGHHPHQQPHARTATTRSSGAASTTGSTTPNASANWPSCGPRCRRPARCCREQVAAFVGRLRSQPFASAFQRAPGIAESVEWAKALVALDTLELDPEVVVDTAGILFKQRDDVAALTRELAIGPAQARRGGRALTARVQQLGDARSGKLAGNIAGFGRALRRAGVRIDSARIALAQQAAQLVGVASKADLARRAWRPCWSAASRTAASSANCSRPTSAIPRWPTSCWRRCCPAPKARPSRRKRRPRVREALAPQQALRPTAARRAGPAKSTSTPR